MKSDKGVTITSLIIYVISFTVIMAIITTISTYFYKNLSDTSSASDYKEYAKFNSYFVQEVNKSENLISDCQENYIIFSDGNQFLFQEKAIYFNKVKICKDIENCTFLVESIDGKTIIKVNIKINEKDFNTDYTLKDW